MGDPDVKTLFREGFAETLGAEHDLASMEDLLPPLTAFISQFAAPDFACVMVGQPPTPPITHRGVEGLAEAWRDWSEAFERVRVELEQVRESEHHIAMLVNQVAVTRHGGVEIRQPSAMVLAFEGGQVARLEFHLDREAALRSAGIEEP